MCQLYYGKETWTNSVDEKMEIALWGSKSCPSRLYRSAGLWAYFFLSESGRDRTFVEAREAFQWTLKSQG